MWKSHRIGSAPSNTSSIKRRCPVSCIAVCGNLAAVSGKSLEQAAAAIEDSGVVEVNLMDQRRQHARGVRRICPKRADQPRKARLAAWGIGCLVHGICTCVKNAHLGSVQEAFDPRFDPIEVAHVPGHRVRLAGQVCIGDRQQQASGVLTQEAARRID